jgi:GntR family transcriptional regulator
MLLPFSVTLVPGESPYRQVVFAATRAVLSGELVEGTAFPSVREISSALKINPNTAHKVVAELVRNGLLEVLPGVGTVVARGHAASAAERRTLLSGRVEQLVVEARRLGLAREDVLRAIGQQWTRLFGDDAAPHAGRSPGEHPATHDGEAGNDE